MKRIMMLLVFLIPLLFIGSIETAAQDSREQTIANMVSKLQQKVLLTEDQKNQIVNIIRSDNSEGMGNARGRVEEILDQRQKAKYNIIKDDWWKSLNRDLKAK